MVDAAEYQQMWNMAIQLAKEEAESWSVNKREFIKERAEFHIRNMLSDIKQS